MPRYQARHDRDSFVLRDEHGAEVHIDPAHGNTVTRFSVASDRGPLDLLIPATTAGPNGYAAGVPILFPFPNRVAAGRYAFAGREHELERNETGGRNHIHGFVRSRPWIVEETGASATEGAWQRSAIRLDAFAEVRRQYPFPCSLTVTTRLRERVLVLEATARNTGTTPLPMGYGLHPWLFAAHVGSHRSETQLRVPATASWEALDRLPTGRRIALDGLRGPDARLDLRTWRPLADAGYDDVLTGVVRRPDGWTEAAVRYPGRGLQIDVTASPSFREWAIFAPIDRDAVCLEPYSGGTNAVNLETQAIDAGLVTLPPGATWSGTVRISARLRDT